MQLPADEQRDEKVMGIPKPLKVCVTSLFRSEPDHGCKAQGHDPTSGSWPSKEVGREEDNDALAGCFSVRISVGELGKVEHVRYDVNGGADDYGPSRCLVEGDALVKRDDVVERGLA